MRLSSGHLFGLRPGRRRFEALEFRPVVLDVPDDSLTLGS